MKTNPNIFRQVIPVHFFKGKNSAGESVMRMRGIASTPSKDTDDEYLDPNGFDLQYFLKNGFINWDHQVKNDPSAIIGRPTLAFVNSSKELEIEYDLFNSSEKAKQVYKLAETLEKEGMQLGLSIEGKAIRRGSEDEANPLYKRVLEARITGCAITPMPKNWDTVTNIIKGCDYELLSAYGDSDDDDVEKALTAGSPSGRAITLESVDKKLKDISKSEALSQIFTDFSDINEESAENIYNLTLDIEKSNTRNMETIVVTKESLDKAYETLGLEKTEEQVIDIEKGENTDEISAEDQECLDLIQKGEEQVAALRDMVSDKSLLKKGEGRNVDADNESFEKKGYGKDYMPDDYMKDMKKGDGKEYSKEEKEEMYKAEKEKKMYNTGEKKDYFYKATMYKGKHAYKKMYKDRDDKEMEADANYYMKGKDGKYAKMDMEDKKYSEMEKSESEEITGAAGLVDLIKSESKALNKNVNERFNALGTLSKGLQDELGGLAARLEKIESEPMQRKSIRSVKEGEFIQRNFADGNDISKGEADNNGDKLILNHQNINHKSKILDIMDDLSNISKGEGADVNMPMAQAMGTYEASGFLSKGMAIEIMSKEPKVTIL